ncbi:hypothetical protein GCM10009527_064910 [Actinomadura nitritigenes]|uniref:Uncharacterized protein n=1 Tax=Actinomadura nitritigenes TaxID=134602 RepID=A0ABS3R1Q6_9ACTN|nr:hypothetical protein [Actinomadura nitritigenes]MBO2440193.1 hypothetical protein [Actinomadura nitritigenes]
MLFSIPESGWRTIAIAATAFFMLGIRALPVGLDVPDDARGERAEPNGRGKWAFYLLTPLFAAIVLGTSLLRPGASSPILFLYSVAFASIPIAVLPVRGRLLGAYLAQREHPGAEEKPDRPAVVWIVAVVSVALLAAVIALMSSPYGSPA